MPTLSGRPRRKSIRPKNISSPQETNFPFSSNKEKHVRPPQPTKMRKCAVCHIGQPTRSKSWSPVALTKNNTIPLTHHNHTNNMIQSSFFCCLAFAAAAGFVSFCRPPTPNKVEKDRCTVGGLPRSLESRASTLDGGRGVGGAGRRHSRGR